MIDEVFARFHVAIAGVAAVVFFLMLLSFRSVAIAVKAVVSIALTQALVCYHADNHNRMSCYRTS